MLELTMLSNRHRARPCVLLVEQAALPLSSPRSNLCNNSLIPVAVFPPTPCPHTQCTWLTTCMQMLRHKAQGGQCPTLSQIQDGSSSQAPAQAWPTITGPDIPTTHSSQHAVIQPTAHADVFSPPQNESPEAHAMPWGEGLGAGIAFSSFPIPRYLGKPDEPHGKKQTNTLSLFFLVFFQVGRGRRKQRGKNISPAL